VVLLALANHVLSRKSEGRFLKIKVVVNKISMYAGLLILSMFLLSMAFIFFVGFPE
jgi:hypothetical protein